MSNLNYTNWWRNGTIGATKNSTEITGASTYWSTTNINPGDIFIDNSGIYEIQNVTDDTHLTLATPYLGETGTGLAYAIIRNFTATTNAKVAAMTSELMYEFARFIDNERSTITGKSAYEIWKDEGNIGTVADYLESLKAKNEYELAQQNGFTGTLAEWLESLKAAGEWSSANTRLLKMESFIFANPWVRNMYIRGKNLGSTITDEQYYAINHFTGNPDTDLYIGDYWDIRVGGTTMRFIIAGLQRKGSHLQEDGTPAPNGDSVGAHIYLMTNRSGPYSTVANDQGYLGSTMHTEVMPALLEEVEAAIGTEHICNIARSYNDENNYNEYGVEHTVGGNYSKLELFHLSQLTWLSSGETMKSVYVPLPLFQKPFSYSEGVPSFNYGCKCHTWVQERNGNPIVHSPSNWYRDWIGANRDYNPYLVLIP